MKRLFILLLFAATIVEAQTDVKSLRSKMIDTVEQFIPATDVTYGLLAYNPFTHRWNATQNGVKYQVDFAKITSGNSNYTGASPSTITVNNYPIGTTLSDKSVSDLLENIYAPYIYPSWSSFSVSSLNANIPDGTTLGTSYTFNVATSKGSGAYTTATVYDITGGNTALSPTITLSSGNGSSSVTTVARKIEVSGTYTAQQWNAKFTDINKGTTYTSSSITITPRQYLYMGSSATQVTSNYTAITQGSGCSTSTSQPLLWTSAQTDIVCSGSNQYLYLIIPTTRSFSGTGSNLDALGANVSFTNVAIINVVNADGSTTRSYYVWEHNHGAAFVAPNRIQITIN